MAKPVTLLPSRRLWHRLLEVTRSALASGALVPIETAFDCVEQDGVRFLVRVATNLRRKAALQPK